MQSELDFLVKIKQWRKKVVVVLSKADLLEDQAQMDEILGFLKKNFDVIFILRFNMTVPGTLGDATTHLSGQLQESAEGKVEQGREIGGKFAVGRIPIWKVGGVHLEHAECRGTHAT